MSHREQATRLCPWKQPNCKWVWKHQSDVDYQVIKNEYDITNVSRLVGNNASTQKGKVNGLLANNARIFEKEIFLKDDSYMY